MKTILATCFFPAFNPQFSGGEKRLFDFYDALSKHYKIKLITLGYPTRYEEINHNENFIEYRVDKPKNIDNYYESLNKRGAEGDLCHVVARALGFSYEKLISKFDEHVVDADLIIHEFPSGFAIDNISKYPKKKRIYNSHNFEYGLAFDTIKTEDTDNEVLETIYKAECDLINASDAIFAMSNEECEAFNLIYNKSQSKIHHIPMGYKNFDLKETHKENENNKKNKSVIFVGSSHLPNIKAVKSLINSARKLPNIDFNIAGSICEKLDDNLPSNVIKHGLVSEKKKVELYKSSDIFVNYIEEGAGVNVKLIEAMSYGLSIVSTKFGTRGAITKGYPISYVNSPVELLDAIKSTKKTCTKERIELCKLTSENHGYNSISLKVRNIIESLLSNSPKEDIKTESLNLYLNDYPTGEAIFGGSKRIDRLIGWDNNSKNILLCFSDKEKFKLSIKKRNYIEIQIPKNKDHLQFEKLINEGKNISSSDIVSMLFSHENKLLVRIFNNLKARIKNLIFCHCYMAPIIDLLSENEKKHINFIYDSHNAESKLKKDLFKGDTTKITNKLLETLETTEEYLIKNSNKIITVSVEDANYFQEKYNIKLDINTVENGTDVNHIDTDLIVTKVPKKIVFLGSAHPPNVEGVHRFINKNLEKLNGWEIHLIGSVCDSIYDISNPNIILHGTVDEDTKNNILLSCGIAINPIISGGGSSLKVSDYMSSGLPIISTEFGIRGFNIEENEHILCEELDNFHNSIINLSENLNLYNHVRRKSYDWVNNNLSWNNLRKKYSSSFVTGEHHTNSPKKTNKKLLVITYRYSEPQFGGGEIYLDQLLKRLYKNHNVDIDIICPDKYHFQEHEGYVSKFEEFPSEKVCLLGSHLRNLTQYKTNKRNKEVLQSVVNNIEKEKEKNKQDFEKIILQSLEQPALLDGWYSLENDSFRWTNGEATILIPKRFTSISIQLYTERELNLSINLKNKNLIDTVINKSELIHLDISSFPKENKIISLNSDKFNSEDGRLLGVIVSKITLTDENSNEYSIDFTIDKNETLNNVPPIKKCKVYRDIALKRNTELNEDFKYARGLKSEELLNDLEKMAHNYDSILLHGIQFDLIFDAAKKLKEMGVKYYSLPHSHPDDEFYHWEPMYNVIKGACGVFTFESELQKSFTIDLNDKPIIVPGGGIDLEESTLLNQNQWLEIKKKYKIKDNYFIVAGRKSPSKNYETIISAFEKSSIGESCTLVLIGPDEDKKEIKSKSIVYLNRQPRDILITAISNSISLINMSSSESFGMVIAESWLLNTPVIVNKHCEAFNSLVDNYENGILVSNENEIIEAMKKLLDNHELCHQLGVNGHKKVIENYTWDSISNNYYRELFNIKE